MELSVAIQAKVEVTPSNWNFGFQPTNILKNFFESIYVVFDKGAAAGTQPAAASFRVKSQPETIVESAIRLQDLKSALQLLLQRQINISSASV